MRILNEKGQEITFEEANLDLGFLRPDKIFVAHHDKVPATPRQAHFEVTAFYFDNAEPLTPVDQRDPHLVIIDAQTGLFDYKNLPGENRTLKGIDLQEVVDAEEVQEKEAYDEYEDIQRYVLYTPQELSKRDEEKAVAKKKEHFMLTGPDRLTSAEIEVSDLTVLIAELTAM